jgi:GNAT superfamily N-acetyltransferase
MTAVRPARRGDLARLWELLLGLAEYERMTDKVSGSAEQLGAALFDAPMGLECRVAERDGRLVGYALFYPTFSSFRTRRMLWLEDLFVEPSERGRGTGEALLAEVCRRGVELGCARVDWYVLDWNAPAIGFYERMGARHAPPEWLAYGLDEAGMRARAAGDGSPGRVESAENDFS